MPESSKSRHCAQISLASILVATGLLACGARSELFVLVHESFDSAAPPDASVRDTRFLDRAIGEPDDAPDTAVDAPFEERIPPRQAPIFVSSRTQLYGFFRIFVSSP